MCPSSGENHCIYVTLVFVTLYGWRLIQTPPIQCDKYQCRIDTVIFLLMMGTWMPETRREEK